MFQFEKVATGNPTFLPAFNQVVQESRWRLLDLGHLNGSSQTPAAANLDNTMASGIDVLLMKNHSFELIG